ncbi:MAG TPA: alpha/beta hydrolase [Hyphomonadaceae bacterium]|jgi:acetyl esterase/lipase|nr:alpha/beta hydrolase [Hyphomonadaceae bacterium]
MGAVIDRRALLLAGASLAGACATGLGAAQDVSVETFDLWPGAPPGSPAVAPKEEIIERSRDPAHPDRAVIHIAKPTLKVFRPARPDGSAVLVAPGGGYQRVVLDKEGDETAMRLARAGVTAAVLVYRLPGDGWAAGLDVSLNDAQRAMRLLRSRVAGMDARRVGVLGFSAGGHVAASLALRSGASPYARVDAADDLPARPDFAALIYAAYLDGNGLPPGFRGENLIGMASGAQPMFLLHAADDATVPVERSLAMYAALKAAGVAAELHVFPEGGHGFGIERAKGKPVEVWPELFLAWGRARGMFRA